MPTQDDNVDMNKPKVDAIEMASYHIVVHTTKGTRLEVGGPCTDEQAWKLYREPFATRSQLASLLADNAALRGTVEIREKLIAKQALELDGLKDYSVIMGAFPVNSRGESITPHICQVDPRCTARKCIVCEKPMSFDAATE